MSRPASLWWWCRLSRMTTWPTHRARARWRRQHERYERRQRMLTRRALRRKSAGKQEVRPA